MIFQKSHKYHVSVSKTKNYKKNVVRARAPYQPATLFVVCCLLFVVLLFVVCFLSCVVVVLVVLVAAVFFGCCCDGVGVGVVIVLFFFLTWVATVVSKNIQNWVEHCKR